MPKYLKIKQTSYQIKYVPFSYLDKSTSIVAKLKRMYKAKFHMCLKAGVFGYSVDRTALFEQMIK